MQKAFAKISFLLALCLLFLIAGPAYGWHDKTHLAIAQAASFENWYNCAAPDVTKTKTKKIEADGKKKGAYDIESPNHWANNTSLKSGEVVTEKIVWDQVDQYDKLPKPGDKEEGRLYGAIIASLREYIRESNDPEKGKYGGYHLAFCAHYIGDLSMPLHNVPYGKDKFNNDKRHKRNDGIIEYSVLDNIGFIKKNMYHIDIRNEDDLVRHIARIANLSRRLAQKMEKEKDSQERNHVGDMKPEEAYAQVIHSASLLKAVIKYAQTQTKN